MAATTATTTAVAVIRDWRGWPTVLRALWRSSLRFRTLTITLLLTSTAILITCVTMALVIQSDLFESRKNEALEDAARSVNQAQATLDATALGDDPAALPELWDSVQEDLGRNSTAEGLAGFRMEVDPDIPLNGFTAGLSDNLISSGLRNRVVEFDDWQSWQSVSLEVGGREVPGIIVGQQLRVPEAGPFAIYFAYDLADADNTLLFVQRTLWVAGIGLVAIVAAISFIVLRTVSTPIVEAAETSARLASGDLGVRIDVHGEDEIATLGRSFNAMADSIESQIKELGELSLVQQRFVSDVSHELRTPLTTIRLAADMLNDQRGAFDPTTARTTELLHTQVQRFETLLSDLLEISRYDAGSVQLELEATSLAHLAEDIIEQMQPLADDRGSELRLVAPGGYSPVDMDPRRVRRVLRNLIGNAIEHGEGRPIVVTVDSNQHAVAAGVRDFGLGMDPADAERVFDRFWRADPSRQRTLGGTGLGLSIALGDATLHGGSLDVWSELGVGTNFVLTLPRRGDATEGPSPIPIEPQERLGEPGDATQPIQLADVPAELFDRGSIE
ncbi:two-component system sensor histidine kinase MtrB [Microbacterium foliorum]|jgi:two-component system sensor histidine kinase MtrB|uniref:Sensor histidine kinase MtrB n=1 Tax=Microbacterium foliorum TaxID=104336 RepID=A0ABU1HLY8_9MICO|nr:MULTISPECIES: MtrAB system histidine kinase MtrB [Microbacterium]KIP88367.1 histidine kinase [Microbacterium sp. MEJ108Y]KQR49559.1 histidine kinase [Microbacterium sp. Leaf161]MDR6141058.1 two-component system sensor histidine kinase MtrB [Microbacterium foliorum]